MSSNAIIKTGAERASVFAHEQGSFIDKWLFFAVFLIGTGGIMLLRMVGLGATVIIWPVACMLLYLGIVRLTNRHYLRADQAGDNIYYLGFLYTLVSLSAALYYFTDGEKAIDQIVSNFGIALASTIIGVALRVVMHQMREDPLGVEHKARLSLAEASSRLCSELDVSVQSFNSFTRQIEQSMEEAITRLGETANNLLRESSELVAHASKKASDGIGEAFFVYNEQTKSLTAVSRRQVQATEKLIQRIEEIEAPNDLIERKIAPAAEQLVFLVEQMKKRERLNEDMIEGFSGSVETMSRSSVEMQNHVTSMRNNIVLIGKFSEKLQEITKKVESIDPALSKTAESIKGFSEIQAEAANAQGETLRGQVNMLDELRLALRGQLEEFQHNLRQQSEASFQETTEVTRALARRESETYDSFARQAEENLAALRKSREASEMEASLAREATNEVLRHLSDMVCTLGNQLGMAPAQKPQESDPSV